MSVDYIVASLPALVFGMSAPMSYEQLAARCGGEVRLSERWRDLESELRNQLVECRRGANGASERFLRPVRGCHLYWRNRVLTAFQERDVLKREELLDRVWWDAAGELTPSDSPLSQGALETYAIRLAILIKRDKISQDAGNAAFDQITAETRR